MNKRLLTLDDLQPAAVAERRVLVRVDFNLPMEGDRITDDTRLKAALPTVRELQSRGARLALISHRGRPGRERKAELSLTPIAAALAAELGRPVAMASDCVGPPASEVIERLQPGEVCLLENLRFHPGEQANDPGFADQLASMADTYVSDAFGTLHRAHASTDTVLRHFAKRKAAGRLVEKEVATLACLLGKVERPYLGVIGGAKIGGKIDTLRRLVQTVDVLLIGGAMANTFLASRGAELGRSLLEPGHVEFAAEIDDRCQQAGIELVLPEDLVVTRDLEAESPVSEVVATTEVATDQLAVDIGPDSARRFAARIAKARTLFWNGPMGVFEKPPFDAGSRIVARAVGDCRGFTVVGGGETGAVVKMAGVASRIDHISTGGGASLALIAGKQLPGLEALSS